MATVDFSYYTETYLGNSVAESGFDRYEKRAEDVIKNVTRGVDITPLPADVQEAYKAAICYQIDYFAEVGLSTAVTGSAATSYTLGRVRVENGAASKGVRSMVSPAAISILEMIPVKGAWVF